MTTAAKGFFTQKFSPRDVLSAEVVRLKIFVQPHFVSRLTRVFARKSSDSKNVTLRLPVSVDKSEFKIMCNGAKKRLKDQDSRFTVSRRDTVSRLRIPGLNRVVTVVVQLYCDVCDWCQHCVSCWINSLRLIVDVAAFFLVTKLQIWLRLRPHLVKANSPASNTG